MATLVLSTVGNALGGPIGGALGALIGQSFDQQLLAPPRRGPRLGDLAVQTSAYGTQIPRIYGSMRVAGSVVWATDLVESEQTSGAKGQPDVVYGYSVSLAVALSSRPARGIGRIWAAGKLLRGADGDFKVPVVFRFYEGGEAQDIDPLIGSVEGIAKTPAYRGLALAVFEDLELAEFGNRIPMMTFELLADEEVPSVGTILADASAGVIRSEAEDIVGGYAAYGRSVASAVQPLVDAFDVTLFHDGSKLRSPPNHETVLIGRDELGCSADSRAASRVERQQLPARAAASALRLSYYDPQRDYQAGEARAIAGEADPNEVQQELPAVVDAPHAKSLAEQMLARSWKQRDRMVLKLPPARIGLEPGMAVRLPTTPYAWLVDKCTLEGFVTIAELRPLTHAAGVLAADAGRIVANRDIVEGPVTLALIEGPSVSQQPGSSAIFLAASSPTVGWKTRGSDHRGLGPNDWYADRGP